MGWVQQYFILEENERRWNRFIRKMFSKRLTVKQKERLLYTFRFLSIIFILLVADAYSKPSLVKVVDQNSRVINNVSIDVVGGYNKRYNSTHYIIYSNDSFLLRIYLYNITVFQDTLRGGLNYVVRCSVADMKIRVPSPDINVKVYLVGSDRNWSLIGRREYVLRQVPFGTYRIVLKGSVVRERTFYFTGGIVDVSKNVFFNNLFIVVLFIAFIPSLMYLFYILLVRHRKKIRSMRTGKRSMKKEIKQKTATKDKGKRRATRKGTLADILYSLPG